MRAGASFHLVLLLLASIWSGLDAKLNSDVGSLSFFSETVGPSTRDEQSMLLPHIDNMDLVRISHISNLRSNGETFHPPSLGQYLIRVRMPVKKGLANELRRLTKGSVRYVPHATFLADVEASTLSAVLAMEDVTDIFVHPSSLKLGTDLKDEISNFRRSDDGNQQATVGALLLKNRGDSRKLAESWQQTLMHEDLGGPTVLVYFETEKAVNVRTDKAHLGSVAEWVASQDIVQNVIWNKAATTQEYFYDQAIQAGKQGWTGTPVWDKGIRGQNQVITVSDTGVDEESCVFYDSTTAVAKCAGTVGYVPSCFDTSHRKIISNQLSGYYRPGLTGYPSPADSDFYDLVKGHGTQCASLAAGSKGTFANGDFEFFITGVAPEAKLIIYDCNQEDPPANAGDPASVWYPSDWDGWLSHSYQGGSRVHSASWVISSSPSTGNAYNYQTVSADQFVYDHPDYVMVFAAGNQGVAGYFSILEPSTGKNVLAVGLSKNTRSAYNDPLRCKADSTTCGHVGHLMTVNSAQWQTIISYTQSNLRGITMDGRFTKTGQFWSFYDWFREATGGCTANQCGNMHGKYDYYFADEEFSSVTESNTLEIKPEYWGAWGTDVPDNAALAADLVTPPDHPCGCDVVAGSMAGKVLLVHWDWSRPGASNMCFQKAMYQHLNKVSAGAKFPTADSVNHRSCTMDEAWTTIKLSGAKSVILIGYSHVVIDNEVIPDPSTFETLTKPSTEDGSGPAAYQIKNGFGQILFAALAKDLFLHYIDFYNNYVENDVSDDVYSGYEDYSVSQQVYDDFMGSLPKLAMYNPTYVADGAWTMSSLSVELDSGITHDTWLETTSRGPTYDLRFKPDIICAGDLVASARSDDTDTGNGAGTEHCPANADVIEEEDWMATSGTSMATPNCAGGVALIQQYFAEGWHVDGTAGNPGSGFSPSAALVKAMVINSGQPIRITGNKPDTTDSPGAPYTLKLEGYPNYFTGFGFMSIGHVLMFSDSDFSLLFEDRANEAADALQTGDVYQTCFDVTTGDVDLVVSLVWTDKVGAANAGRVLINNLDLVVVSPSGTFYYGNHLTHASYGSVPDSLNNLERVTVAAPEVGGWSVRVIAADVPDGPQGFALVGTGDMADNGQGACAGLAACDGGCSGHGVCNQGRCVCTVGFAGADCSVAIVELTDGVASAEQTVEPVRTNYYYIDLSMYDSADLQIDVAHSSSTATADRTYLDVQATDCGYPDMDDVRLSEYEVGATGLTTTLSTTGTCGLWVIGVTANSNPRSLEKTSPLFATQTALQSVAFTVTATVTASSGNGGACTVPPAGCAPVGPSVDKLALNNLPNTDYARCNVTKTWPEITSMQVADDTRVKTGGLGTQMQVDKFEVWLCLVDHVCSGTNDPICFVYDEADRMFKVWGLNSELEIF